MKNPVSATMTVTVTMDGKEFKLSEAEARKLHAALGEIFKTPATVYLNRPNPWGGGYLPSQYPTTLMKLPDPKPFEITCSSVGR